MKTTRRELLSLLAPALGGAALIPNAGLAADEKKNSDAESKSDLPWPEQRKSIERKWLDLLGDFPTDIPALKPEMKKVAVEEGITRYHVSFQSEPDDRVTAWLLVPDAARLQPTPAIICIHSTTFGSGKDSTIGLSGRRPIP